MSDEREIMNPLRFKHGLLRLCDRDDPKLVSETVVARRIASLYIDADDEAKADLSEMLRDDIDLEDESTHVVIGIGSSKAFHCLDCAPESEVEA